LSIASMAAAAPDDEPDDAAEMDKSKEASRRVHASMSPITSRQSTVSILVLIAPPSLTALAVMALTAAALAARLLRSRRFIIPPTRSMEGPFTSVLITTLRLVMEPSKLGDDALVTSRALPALLDPIPRKAPWRPMAVLITLLRTPRTPDLTLDSGLGRGGSVTAAA